MCDSLGIHFAIITDRNTVQPMMDSLDQRFGMSLIVPGVEISSDHGHGGFLVIGDSIPLVPRHGISSDSVVHDALDKNDIVIRTDGSDSDGRPDSYLRNVTGIELYNFSEDWRDQLNFFRINKIIAAYIVYGFQDEALNYLIDYPVKEMKMFDELNASQRVVGVGGLDARSNVRIWNNLYWHFPSYQSLFNLVHTIIVTREPFNGLYHHDREVTLNAIRKGNMFVSFSGLKTRAASCSRRLPTKPKP